MLGTNAKKQYLVFLSVSISISCHFFFQEVKAKLQRANDIPKNYSHVGIVG